MRYKYNISDLKYIESLKHKRKAVVYYNEKKEKYVDVNSNSIISYNNERLYNQKDIKLIENLDKILSYYDLWLLLIDSSGKKHTEVPASVINELISIFEKINSYNDILKREIDYISHLVTEICISNLILSQNKKNQDNNFDLVINGIDSCFSEEEEIKLRKLILNYIFIDTAINGLTERNLIIRKENNTIDYKILRILKYLGMDVKIEEIPDFKIEYNLEGIKYYDSKGNKTIDSNIDREEVEKVKKMIDKRAF